MYLFGEGIYRSSSDVVYRGRIRSSAVDAVDAVLRSAVDAILSSAVDAILRSAVDTVFRSAVVAILRSAVIFDM